MISAQIQCFEKCDAFLRGKSSAKITYALVHLCAIVRLLPDRLDRKALFIEFKRPGNLANTCHSLFMESSCSAENWWPAKSNSSSMVNTQARTVCDFSFWSTKMDSN